MSRRIAALLGEEERLVTKRIAELEAKNGYPSHDVRLLAENVQKIRTKLSDLVLDPEDTTAEELYHTLLAKFNHDSRRFDTYYRVDGLGFDEKNAKAIALLDSHVEMPQQWAVKNTVAKKILRQHTPKHVMKYLHYRSAESMLKRENVQELLLAAKQLESAAWQKAFDKLVSGLDQTDIEMRAVKIQYVSYRRWSKVEGPLNFVVHDNNSATIALWPSPKLTKSPLLTLILILAEELSRYDRQSTANYLAKMGDMVNWWLDMDHLISSLSAEPVSLSLKDNALNVLRQNSYEQRELNHARKSFWQELVSRYENLPDIDGLFDNSVKEEVAKLKLAVPDLSYEFAEDI